MTTVTTNGVDRREKLSYRAFAQEYLKPNKPVVITDALRSWKAMTTWSPAFFKERYGGLEWTLNGRRYTTAELVDLMERSSRETPAPYLHSIQLEDHFSELLPDVSPTPSYLFPNWLESGLVPTKTVGHAFYLGGRGSSFPVLHYDTQHTHAFLCQICGQKEYICYHPDETPNLYPRPNPSEHNISQVDVWNPDLKKFPQFARAKEIRFLLNPGELLFVPAGWWHTVQILSPSITISKCTVNGSNWRDYTLDVCYRSNRIKKPLSVPAHLCMLGVGALLATRDVIRPPA